MMKTYYRKAKGSLLVYDVTNRSSFVGLEVGIAQRGGGGDGEGGVRKSIAAGGAGGTTRGEK